MDLKKVDEESECVIFLIDISAFWVTFIALTLMIGWQPGRKGIWHVQNLYQFIYEIIFSFGETDQPEKTQKMKTGYTELYYDKFRFWL